MKIEDLIYENYNKLNENDLYIWNYILSNKEACSNMSMQELASNCNVSHTTILRFAQKLGLEGYSELKIYLKWGTKSKYSFNEEEIDKTHNDIVKTMDVLKNQDFSDLFKLLDSANKIYAYGTGAVQKNAANEIKRTFLTVGRLINVLEGKDELYEIGRNLQENEDYNDTADKTDKLICILNREIRNIDQTNAVIEFKHMLGAFIQIADISQSILHFGVDLLKKIPCLPSSFVADD